MSAETQTADDAQLAWERIETMSTRRLFRFYFERLWYTTRGRFAFVAGLLMVMYTSTETIRYSDAGPEPVIAGGVDQFIIQQFSQGLLEALGAGLGLFVAVLTGATLLAFIDLYEAEVGTVVDVEE